VFSPDGQRVLTASSDNTARLWDVDGKPLATLEGHKGTTRASLLAAVTGRKRGVTSAVFSVNSQRILTASYDNMARLWDTDGKPLATLEGHKDAVNSAVFSADGQRILTVSDDKTARLWDAGGKPLATLEGHKDAVNSAVFSADRAFLITASRDQTARLWRAYRDPQELVDVAKERVTRCLTPRQREELFLLAEPPAWCKSKGKWPNNIATLAPAMVEAAR
jgi:WD40 repeat protein